MKKFSIFTISMMLIIATLGIVMADPNGANTVTEETTSRAGTGAAQNHSAIAGNVTELTISGETVTQTWQGYYGNASGSITLESSAGDVLYNWSAASPQGEIFASNSSSITWGNIECFNWATHGVGTETYFNIAQTDVDGLNETFSASNDHDAFDVGGTAFSAGDCMAAFIFDSTGASVDGNFEEVLLHDTNSTVFAALLEDNLAGFDALEHDFEMLVLEDGHGGDTSTTPYFFYVELE